MENRGTGIGQVLSKCYLLLEIMDDSDTGYYGVCYMVKVVVRSMNPERTKNKSYYII